MKKLLILLFLLPNISLSSVYFTEAESLYKNCNSSKIENTTFCLGFIGAVFDGLIREHHFKKIAIKKDDPDYQACKINRVSSLSQVVEVVNQWLTENPRKRADSAEAVVDDVLTVWLECGSKGAIEYLKENGY